MGVFKEIYRFPHNITYPYSTCNSSFFAATSLLLCSLKTCFSFFHVCSTSYHSKILRFDVDNRDPGKEYAVPPDNPFIGDPNALPEIYSYGWRMPWKCAVDRGDPKTREGAGRVFCTDVGTNVTEEVNLLVKGGNYGRPIFEGDVCLVDKQTCDACQL